MKPLRDNLETVSATLSICYPKGRGLTLDIIEDSFRAAIMKHTGLNLAAFRVDVKTTTYADDEDATKVLNVHFGIYFGQNIVPLKITSSGGKTKFEAADILLNFVKE